MLQLLEDIPRYLERIYPDEIQWVVDHWGQPHELTESLSHWPTDASRDAKPISCHSHNDYWRDVPLYSALNAGCTSVEADVWLFNNNFYVGHTTSSLTAERTLRSLYLEPLLDLIQKQNPTTPFRQDREALQGIFDTEASQPIVLLIDFKTPGAEIWPELLAQLSPLRERNYLTYFNGTAIIQRPITIVASGNAPFDLIIANTTYRDVFFDAPLSQIGDFSSQWPNPNLLPDAEKLANNALLFNPDVPGLRPADPSEGEAGDVVTPEALESYHVNNSHYASTSFTKSVGYIWGSRLSQQQLQILRSQIRGAHERGLKARYWGLPYWPIGLRNHVWHILMREGADVLSVDDLFGATRRDWRRSKGLSF
ncbi:Altered inheritance of mitochondria protein 6 [Hypocenomyce scalaris]|nr:Altered inheritance of mitochondria protein 6 [Hypocenomyce scalaris]